MFEIDDNFNWKIREKRARKRICLTKAANEIGITRQTLRHIESGEKKSCSKTVYKKIVDWIMND